MSSIFVTPSGEWRLGGMDHVCSFDKATPDYLNKYKPLRNQDSLALEEKVLYKSLLD